MEILVNRELGTHPTVAPVLRDLLGDNEDRDRFRWCTSIGFDLRRHTDAALCKLRDAVAGSGVRGSKVLAKDIQTWLDAKKSVAKLHNTRARTVKQAAGLLQAAIAATPRKHVYEVQAGETSGVTLCYYVQSVKFVPAEKTKNNYVPPYVVLKLYYEEFGVSYNTERSLYPAQVLDKTVIDMLLERNMYLESPSLRADYEYYIDTYTEMVNAVGRQYWARGMADDSGVDGNGKDRGDQWYRSTRGMRLTLDKDGTPTRVVIDVFHETDDDTRRTRRKCDATYNFWTQYLEYGGVPDVEQTEDGDERLVYTAADESNIEDDASEHAKLQVPIHPYVVCFDLQRHLRLRVHVGNLELYEYNPNVKGALVLPDRHRRLIDTLLSCNSVAFKDVIANKSGGLIILCQGAPGTGKTLTAEIYAECEGRALYTVQCSQLGTTVDELEDNLMKVLARGRRWGAVMLLDEADVYVHKRGSDLQQNAIVGVFLRVLEYHAGTLFLTTNRGDMVDDAILSRCTARVPYSTPSKDDQVKIWKSLAQTNGVPLPDDTIADIVDEFPRLSGRDIKNLLKLALIVSKDSGQTIDAALIADVKDFKPTLGDYGDEYDND